MDVLPGLYEAATYRAELTKLASLHSAVSNLETDSERSIFLTKYHQEKIANVGVDSGRLVSTNLPRTSHNRLANVDTTYNEVIRRKSIHQRSGKMGLFQPEQQSKWLYREVLNANLDDPYMGLGDSLFANYPFQD